MEAHRFPNLESFSFLSHSSCRFMTCSQSMLSVPTLAFRSLIRIVIFFSCAFFYARIQPLIKLIFVIFTDTIGWMTFIVTSSFVLKNGLIIFDLGVSRPVNTFVLSISFTRVWSIIFFIIKIHHPSGQYFFLSSLCSTGFPHFKHIKVIFSHFQCYLNGFPGLPECLGISYSYIGCWLSCQMGHSPRGFQRISTFTIIFSIYTQLFLSELEIGSNSRGTLIGVLAKNC